jgi:IstB-like ATP binding protein
VTAAVPAPPPLDAGLEQLLRRMRLPHMRRVAPEVLATAKAQRWDPAEVLRALLAEEVAGRDRSALGTRRARAGFPTGKTFEAWDERLSSIPAPTQQALRTLEWIGRHENLVVCGPRAPAKYSCSKHSARPPSTPAGTSPGSPSNSSVSSSAWTDDSVTKAITRILQADLVVVDLCRPRDYADMGGGLVARALIRAGFGRAS